MFSPVSSRVSFPELEQRILAFWKERDIFRRSVDEHAGRPRYVFYEGPPTANNSPGIHHVLARVFKDIIPRYWTMKGYYVPRKGGWDTHGLPVELEVEKALGIASKPEIERYGVAAFNEKCRESVFRYVKEWEAMTDRIGFWIDMEHAYVTYHNDYIESGWWIIKQLWEKSLLYQGYKVTPHCPRCGTSLSSHEVALGYRDDTEDPSVFIKFRLTDQANHGKGLPPALISESDYLLRRLRPTADGPIYFLAWTTTPWTLPGNTALAVSEEAHYALIKTEDGQRLILARARLDDSIQGSYTVLETMLGSELVGLHYEPLYEPRRWGLAVDRLQGDGTLLPYDAEKDPEARQHVISGDFVSLEDGTGIVHVAPAFGEIDFEVGRAEALLFTQPVESDGRMPSRSPWAGLFVKDADPLILDELRARHLLYHSAKILHTYPFCWRCESPLLYYAKRSWYIRTTAVKERLLSANEEINWYPDHIKHGRFGDWLENNVDWALSRERYWGTPLNLWRCQSCGQHRCIGSRQELAAQPGVQGFSAEMDLHRPYIDEVTFTCDCGGRMQRVPEVLDCWFDSGAMPVSQWHYPFENQEVFNQNFPADFICEAVDQTRGWFYSLHALAVLLRDGPAYKNVISLGHILDAKGEKMSKSKGNVVNPWSVLDTHGADALRWYLYTATPPGNPRRFSVDLVGEAVRKFLLTLWNTYSFFVTYANIDRFNPSSIQGEPARSELDRWILSELNALIGKVRAELEVYNPTEAGRAIQAFVDDLSNWYVRRSRRRFWKSESDADKQAAYMTLYECLVTLAKLLAPFTPFVADEIYRNLVLSSRKDAPESVHLTTYPEANPALLDASLAADTRLVMRVSSLGRAARSKANLKVRQPLAKVLVKARSQAERDALERLKPQVLDELNVKDMAFVADDSEVVNYEVKPNFSRLGPKYEAQVRQAVATLAAADPGAVAQKALAGLPFTADGYEFAPEDVAVTAMDKPGLAVASEGGYTVALTTEVTPELAAEGLAREIVHRLQTMRRSAGFDIADYIVTYYQGTPEVASVVRQHAGYIRQETLSRELLDAPAPPEAYSERHQVDGYELVLGVKKEPA